MLNKIRKSFKAKSKKKKKQYDEEERPAPLYEGKVGDDDDDDDDDPFKGVPDPRNIVDDYVDSTIAPEKRFVDFCRRGVTGEIAAMLKKDKSLLTYSSAGGYISIHWAAMSNDADTIELLLKSGASVNTVDDNGDSALHIAAFKGNADACYALVKAGGDAQLKNKEGVTPLELCKHLQAREGCCGRDPRLVATETQDAGGTDGINIIKDEDSDDDDSDW